MVLSSSFWSIDQTYDNAPYTVTLDQDLPGGMYYFSLRRWEYDGGDPVEWSPQFILDDPGSIPTDKGLSKGAIVGIVVGAVAAIMLLLIGFWLCWRRKKQRNARKSSISTTSTHPSDDSGLQIAELRAEIDKLKKMNTGSSNTQEEIAGLRAELEAMKNAEMLDGRAVMAEMPGSMPQSVELENLEQNAIQSRTKQDV